MTTSRGFIFLLTLLIQSILPAWGLPTTSIESRAQPVKQFTLTITWANHSPDGYTARDMFLINGQYPGPLIQANQGDLLQITVVNQSPYNTSIHWHGVPQIGTPWSDGVPGVSQRGILPGKSFVYQFTATDYGSYWYHSHSDGQLEDGLLGPIRINPASGTQTPFHLISSDSTAISAMTSAVSKIETLTISDYNHFTDDAKWDIAVNSGIEDSCYDAILFNGKGRDYCLNSADVNAALTDQQKQFLALVPGATMTDKACLPPSVMAAMEGVPASGWSASKIPAGAFSGCNATNAPLEVINAGTYSPSTQTWVAIDLVGAISFISGVVSIDNHDMWVYAMDGGYITPQKVQALVLPNGARYSVLVELKQAGNFSLRCNSNLAPQILTGNAIFEVGGSNPVTTSTPYINIAGNPVSSNVTFFDQSIAAPFPPVSISQTADVLYKLHMENAGATYLWAMNSTGLSPKSIENNEPVLFKAPNVNLQNNVTISTKNNTWVDLVLLTTEPIPHPIHKHSTKMFQIGVGTGDWTWNTVADAIKAKAGTFNLVNPPMRDSFVSNPAPVGEIGWIVVRYHVTNPGAFVLHCHIDNHLVGGMLMVLQDGVDKWPTVPAGYLN